MNITKLKAKNQLTIPQEIIKRLHLRQDELFAIEVDGNFIKLIPVDVEPRYTPEEMAAIDHIVENEKSKAKAIKPGKDFSSYIKKHPRNYRST